MREIKFRGKRIDNGEWVYGGFHKHQLKTPSPIIPKSEKPEEIEYAYLIIESGFSDWNLPKPLLAHEVMPETVGQFTGLYDSQRTEEYPEGQPIYEGDILNSENFPFQHRGHQLHYGVIEWSDEHSAFILRKHLVDPNQSKGSRGIANYLSFYEMSEFTKVGNIHENPELLGGDSE